MMHQVSKKLLQEALALAEARYADAAGVVGVGLARDHVRVYVVDDAVGPRLRLPGRIKDVDVRVIVTGEVEAHA